MDVKLVLLMSCLIVANCKSTILNRNGTTYDYGLCEDMKSEMGSIRQQLMNLKHAAVRIEKHSKQGLKSKIEEICHIKLQQQNCDENQAVQEIKLKVEEIYQMVRKQQDGNETQSTEEMKRKTSEIRQHSNTARAIQEMKLKMEEIRQTMIQQQNRPKKVNGSDQNSLADVKSDVEALQEDLIEDLGTKSGQEIKRHPQYDKCLHGFTYLPSTGNCYKVVYESLDWYAAVRKCQQLRSGSHLAAITSAEENSDVKTFLATEVSSTGNLSNTACIPKNFPTLGIAYWTSGQQLIKNVCKSPFVWRLPREKLLAFDFTSWNKGEPNCGNNGESCVGIEVYNNFVWDDYPCREKMCPLCEYTP